MNNLYGEKSSQGEGSRINVIPSCPDGQLLAVADEAYFRMLETDSGKERKGFIEFNAWVLAAMKQHENVHRRPTVIWETSRLHKES